MVGIERGWFGRSDPNHAIAGRYILSTVGEQLSVPGYAKAAGCPVFLIYLPQFIRCLAARLDFVRRAQYDGLPGTSLDWEDTACCWPVRLESVAQIVARAPS